MVQKRKQLVALLMHTEQIQPLPPSASFKVSDRVSNMKLFKLPLVLFSLSTAAVAIESDAQNNQSEGLNSNSCLSQISNCDSAGVKNVTSTRYEIRRKSTGQLIGWGEGEFVMLNHPDLEIWLDGRAVNSITNDDSENPGDNRFSVYNRFVEVREVNEESSVNAEKVNLTAPVIDRREMANRLAQAVALHNQRQFEQAYEAFDQLFQSLPASLTVNFYLGQTALELKNYNQAMAAFDRVLMLEPNHARTRLELARLYFETDDFEMAQNELDLVLSQPLPDVVRANVLSFKQRIESRIKRHSHAFTMIVGLNYDSNARNDIGASNSFQLPGFANIELSGNEEVEDAGIGLTLVYNHSYDFGERGGWLLENQWVGFNRKHKEISDNDILYLSASSAPTLQGERYKLAFPLEADHVVLNGKRYVNNLTAGMNWQQVLSSSQVWTAGYKLRNMMYPSENSARDAWAHLFSLGYRYHHGQVNPVTYGVQLGFEKRDQKTRSQINDPASLTEKLIRFDLSKPLSERWRVNGALAFRATDYEQYSNEFLNKRSDQVRRIDLGAMYQLDRKGMLSGGVGYADHQSNQGPFEFDKITANINYMLRF